MKEIVEFTALGSGSCGNAFAVRAADGSALLIDAGFSCRELCARLDGAGIAPESIRAVLLTHDHADHACGCRVFCDKWRLPLYATGPTADFLDAEQALPSRVYEFAPGTEFALEGFDVSTFPVSHDACDPVGFVIRRGGASLGIATDLGIVDEPVRRALTGCDMLAFEANYDDSMLAASPRPLSVKRRIQSRVGHLGNADSMRELAGLIGENTSMVTLVHVSRECNDYALVDDLARQMLAGLDRPDIYLDVALQREARPTFRLDGRCRHGAA